MKEIRVLLVGIGGYAVNYVCEMKERGVPEGLILAGVVDPYAAQSPRYEDALSMTSVFCNTVEEFYAEHQADFAVICTPIPLHAPQAIYCMEHGSHVLCEKPVCATVDDVQRMIAARDKTGKKLSIGYQWSHSDAIAAERHRMACGTCP